MLSAISWQCDEITGDRWPIAALRSYGSSFVALENLEFL
jgi:hypothetical protein